MMKPTPFIFIICLLTVGCQKKSSPATVMPKVEIPCPSGDLAVKDTVANLSIESVAFIRQSLANAVGQDDRALVRAVESGLARIPTTEQALFVNIMNKIGAHQITFRIVNRLIVRLSTESDVALRAGLLEKITIVSEQKAIRSNDFSSIF